MDTEHTLKSTLDYFTILVDGHLPVPDRRLALSTLHRLVRSRALSRWSHESGLTYWTRRSPRPLVDRSLVRAYSFTLFCESAKSRSPVTHREIETYFPNLFRHGLPAGHYVDRSEPAMRFGHVRTDAGESKIARLVDRTDRLLHSYRQLPGFKQLIDSGQFEFTWIVPTRAKQQRLIEALQPISISGIRLRVIAMPVLLNIIAPINGRRCRSFADSSPERV